MRTKIKKDYINTRLKKKYEKLEKDRWDKKHFIKQVKQIKESLKNSENTELEKQLWNKFLKNVKEDQKEDEKETFDIGGKGKFKLKHIEDLNVDFDILFVYGKKGIGKTVQLGRLVDKIAEEHPEGIVVLLRNTGKELDALQKQLATSENWPIFLKGHTLYHKYKKKGRSRRYMGFATYLTGEALRGAQGPEYKNVKAIIWDECNYTGSQFGISLKELTKFIVFVSSIVRDNKDVKFYLFGNYLRNEDSSTTNIFLESAGIDPESRLKLIEFDTEDKKDKTRLLYINTGNLYRGIESQKYVGIFGKKIVQDLNDNLPAATSSKLVNLKDFLEAEPIWAFVFNLEREELVIYFAKTYISSTSLPHFICRVEQYDHDRQYLFLPFTDNEHIYNKYTPKMLWKQPEEVENHLIGLQSAFLTRNLWYSGEKTEEFFRHSITFLKKRYRTDYKNTKWV